MIAGYLVAFLVMGLYVFSLYLRSRNLRQDMTMLEELENSAAKEEVKLQPQSRKGKAKPTARQTAKPVTKRAEKKQP
jgi:hypothetical protein